MGEGRQGGLAGILKFGRRYARAWWHHHVMPCPECLKAVDLLCDHFFADPREAIKLLNEMTE